MLSGTWNTWLLNLFNSDNAPEPFFKYISNDDYVSRNDLLKVKYLILKNLNLKVENDIYVDKTKILSLATKFSNPKLVELISFKNL